MEKIRMQSVNLQKANAVMAEVKKAVIGKDTCILKVMAAMIAGGHILLDDIPGVGKTTMALAFSKAMDLKQNRVQFTPDILPADIVGFSMYEKSSGKFVYQPGAVMCNLFLADEINRTSPKTQSALLEVMEEGSVTVDGITKPVPNPEDEIAILKGKSAGDPLNDVMKVMDAASLLEARREAEQIYVHNAIYKYMVRLVNRTRNNDMIELGISPRGTVALAAMAKSCAWLRGRKFVYPDDVADIFYDVAIHRIRLNAKARINHVTAEGLIEQIINETERPTVRRKNV